MGVHDRLRVGSRGVDRRVQSPLARRLAETPGCSVRGKLHHRPLVELIGGNSAGGDQEAAAVPNAQVTSRPVIEADARAPAGEVDQTLATHQRASPKRPIRPCSDAAQIPRSVINPVTSRAGVTSNAGLRAWVPTGATLLPRTWVTSSA